MIAPECLAPDKTWLALIGPVRALGARGADAPAIVGQINVTATAAVGDQIAQPLALGAAVALRKAGTVDLAQARVAGVSADDGAGAFTQPTAGGVNAHTSAVVGQSDGAATTAVDERVAQPLALGTAVALAEAGAVDIDQALVAGEAADDGASPFSQSAAGGMGAHALAVVSQVGITATAAINEREAQATAFGATVTGALAFAQDIHQAHVAGRAPKTIIENIAQALACTAAGGHRRLRHAQKRQYH